ncbi:hypothetical protein [Halobaculum sp. MBLA0143]|uniref:hypothetical protein n=1 Tax=Halobaculum sp. MBLA0143 TaxID=3079933 RepID=UPI0035265CC6
MNGSHYGTVAHGTVDETTTDAQTGRRGSVAATVAAAVLAHVALATLLFPGAAGVAAVGAVGAVLGVAAAA